MRKIVFLALILTLIAVNAAPVSQETAVKAADNWLNKYVLAGKSSRSIENVYTRSKNGINTLYTVTFKNVGFVVVAADDQIMPILGYSVDSYATESTTDNPALNDWLNNYGNAVIIAQDKKIVNNNANTEWQRILSNNFSENKNIKSVEPLVKAMFDQGSPYDMYTPNNWPVGCVATAMSMVMAYYHHPHTGNGTKTYYDSGSGQNLSANFGTTTYDWSRVLNVNTGGSPLGAREMVATLSSHAGIGVSMNYSANGSGSNINNALTAFKSYFRMKSTANIKYRNSYLSTWNSLVKAELDQQRPLYYRGNDYDNNGHAFVCDGYLTNSTTDRFHFNWGWNGSYNGYFLVDSLVPSGTGTGGGTGDYSVNNAAIFDLWDYNPAPEAITGLEVLDKGIGTELFVKWNKSMAANHKNYRIRYGTSTYNYTNSFNITIDTTYTITGLTPGTKYYVAVTDMDLEVGGESDESPVVEIAATPNINPLPPVNLIAEPVWQKISITWTPNTEMDIAGYDLYKSSNGTDYEKVNTTLITNTVYIEENPVHNAYTYYKVKAIDDLNNISAFSEAVSARPVTLNQGVLIIDESSNGSGTVTSPDDAMQDQFYNTVTDGVLTKTNYDAAASGNKVTLSELGPYSSIVWHNQAVELGSVFSFYQSEIKKYLDFGGKILILADKPGKLLESSNSYPVDYPESSIAQSYFGVDSAFYKAAARCNGAIPSTSGYNYLTVDTTKTIASNGYHLKKNETLRAAAGSNIIYTYDSSYDITNTWGTEKGKPLGIEKLTAGYKTVTLALPLYFIEQNEAKIFVENVLANKFGEIVGIEEFAASQTKGLVLLGSYPNPFNPATTIKFYNPAAGNVKVTVYNAKGEMIHELLNNRINAGLQSINFNASALNSGLYFYKITTSESSLSGKMMLLK